MQNKWLMINIQNVQDFACQCLNRDVWSNEAVKNIIREHFIFWQVESQNSVGGRFNRATPVTWCPVRWENESSCLWLQQCCCGSLGELQRLRVCILMPKQPFTSDWKCYCWSTNTYTSRGACSTVEVAETCVCYLLHALYNREKLGMFSRSFVFPFHSVTCFQRGIL